MPGPAKHPFVAMLFLDQLTAPPAFEDATRFINDVQFALRAPQMLALSGDGVDSYEVLLTFPNALVYRAAYDLAFRWLRKINAMIESQDITNNDVERTYAQVVIAGEPWKMRPLRADYPTQTLILQYFK